MDRRVRRSFEPKCRFENQMHADHFAEEEDVPSESTDAVDKREEGDAPAPDDGEHSALSPASFIPHSSLLNRSEFIEKSGRGNEASDRAIDSDESLFLLYQQGDERAFLIIYERYKSSIYAYCAHVLMSAGFDREMVEDTFQEVFLRLAQYQHSFTGGEFKAWIFTVTRHSCLTAKKRAFRHRATTGYIGDGENFDETVPENVRMAFSQNDDPLERMSKAEQIDLLLQAIAKLPEEFREALLLSEYEGLTYDEIGKITGTSLSTSRIRIYRAKARLRKMLLPILGDDVDKLIDLPRSTKTK
jgi:RNA polymerase sigma-70 factor (ECF subfamily)